MKHRLGAEHVFKDQTMQEVPKDAAQTRQSASVAAPDAPARFDRVAYQRAYMKRWRALKSGRALPWPR